MLLMPPGWYAFYRKELPWAPASWRALPGVLAVAAYFRCTLVAVAGFTGLFRAGGRSPRTGRPAPPGRAPRESSQAAWLRRIIDGSSPSIISSCGGTVSGKCLPVYSWLIQVFLIRAPSAFGSNGHSSSTELHIGLTRPEMGSIS